MRMGKSCWRSLERIHLHNSNTDSFGAVMSELAYAGIRGHELCGWYFFPVDASSFGDRLVRIKLSVPNAYYPDGWRILLLLFAGGEGGGLRIFPGASPLVGSG
jgi:hypothetical protein